MTTIKSAKGPMHQDIYPIIARSKDQLEKCYQQMLKFIKEKGGVDVYRIPEGKEQTLAGLQDGDILIVPLGGKLDTKSGDLVLVATFTGDADDVLPHFRFKTKRKWGRENLPYPPAPHQHIEKYAEQETVRNRPNKSPSSSTSYSSSYSSNFSTGSSSSGSTKEIYSCDLDSPSAKVFHFMSEFKKSGKDPTADEAILRVKIEANGKLADLFKKPKGAVVYHKDFSAIDIAVAVWDLDDDTAVDEKSPDVQQILSSLVTFLGEDKAIEGDTKNTWHLYRTCLTLVKTVTELEFLTDLESIASEELGEVCKFTSMCKDEFERRETSLSDDLSTDQDIITDLLVGGST